MPSPEATAADTGITRGEPGIGGRERLVDEELLLLREATRLLGKRLEPDVVIREMLHLLSELLGLNRGRVVLPDAGGATLSIRHAYGLTAAEIARGRYGMGEGVVGRVMATGEPQIVQDIDADSAGPDRRRAESAQEKAAFIAVPIGGERATCGVLAVQRLRGRRRAFSDDMTVLRTVAALIGQLLQLQRLIAERTARLESEQRALGLARETGLAQAGTKPARVYRRVESADRERIVQALAHAGGNKSRAAQTLGLTLRQFNYRCKVLEIG